MGDEVGDEDEDGDEGEEEEVDNEQEGKKEEEAVVVKPARKIQSRYCEAGKVDESWVDPRGRLQWKKVSS